MSETRLLIAYIVMVAFTAFVLWGTYQMTVVEGWSPWWWLPSILFVGSLSISGSALKKD